MRPERMTFDARALGLAAGTAAAALFSVCALAVAVAPAATTAFASSLIHLDLTGLARTLTWRSYFGALLFWSIGAGLLFAGVGGLYNRYLGWRRAPAREPDVAAHRLA